MISDTHYKAYLQMPVLVHGEESHIVEAEIELPSWYMPQHGHFLVHKLVNGLMPLGPVFFDGERDTIVLTTVGSAYDYTTTIEEWLMDRERAGWTLAERPFIEMEKKDDSNDDEGRDD